MEILENICYYLTCCLCCSPYKDRFVSKHIRKKQKRTLRLLESITPPNRRRAIQKKGMAIKDEKPTQMTDIYTIPNDEFKTADEVVAKYKYTIGQMIDRGKFAIVFKATHQDLGVTEELAVKRIDIPVANEKKGGKRSKRLSDVKNELYTLEALSHPHIIKMVNHFMIETTAPEITTRVYIFMQYASNGTLMSYMNVFKAQPEDQCLKWFSQMLHAMVYMHSEGIVHRDLKLENVLLDVAKDILISDFGLSKVFAVNEPGSEAMVTSYCGTVHYMAPEILQRKAEKKAIKYSANKADVWALGVILFVLFNYEYPFGFKDNNYSDIIKQMRKKQYIWTPGKSGNGPTKQLKDIVDRMLEYDTNARKSMGALTAHPWVSLTYNQLNENIVLKNMKTY